MPLTTIIYNGNIIDSTLNQSPIPVTYDNFITTNLNPGDNIRLSCSDKIMLEDVTIGNKKLKSGSKRMLSDVLIQVDNIQSLPIPTIVGTYTYNNAEITPIIVNYDSSKMSMFGDISATAAGSYNITFSLLDPYSYQWDNYTTSDKTVSWSILKKSINIPTVSGIFTYDKSIHNASIENIDVNWVLVSGETSAKNAGTHYIYFNLLDSSNTEWSDKTTTTIDRTWIINKRMLVVPQVTSTQFTGSDIVCSIIDFNSDYEEKSGDLVQKNVGTYTVMFSLLDIENTTWDDGTTYTKERIWQITKMSLIIPSLSGSYTYSGLEQTVLVNGFNSTWITQTGGVEIEAGTHRVSWELKDKTNTQWIDNTVEIKVDNWTINKLSLAIPSQKGSLTYTGLSQSPSWNNYNTTYENISNITSSIDAGTYIATFSLKDIVNTQWNDSTTNNKDVNWNISKAQGYVTLNTTGTQSINNGESGTNSITSSHGGTLSVSNEGSSYCNVSINGTTITVVHNGNTGSSARTVTITVTCAATVNYNQATTSYKVSLAKSSSCVIGDTLILMGDGTEKPIKQLAAGDLVMTWNMLKGCYEPQPIIILWDEHEDIANKLIRLTFSNNSHVDIITEHGFFNKTLNTYVYITENNYRDFIGDYFVIYTENGYGITQLIQAELIIGVSEGQWSLETAYNDNFITNGLLSITGEPFLGRFEYFKINENMIWDAEDMQYCIQKYGLYTSEEWNEILTAEEFNMFNGPWFKVLVGKGLITREEIIQIIETEVRPNSE